MTRRLVLLWLIVAAFLAVGSLTSASCKSYPDDKECRGDKVNALTAGSDAEAANACTTCMQQECCHSVGTCADQPEDACPKQFKKAHECVLDGGPGVEPECKASLTTQSSRELYACVRGEKCGPKCGLPKCKLNPAVTLFGEPDCDRCVGNACCEQVNSCYENRQCKLFLECITEHCPNTLGPTLAASGKVPMDVLEKARLSVCAGDGAPPQIGDARCLQRCIGEFTGRQNPDDEEARCRAFGVYTCAAGAGCGARCTREGGIIFEGAYREDLPDSGVP